jgi:prepilin-type N-terminal cleavage/methylation domain-containing protein
MISPVGTSARTLGRTRRANDNRPKPRGDIPRLPLITRGGFTLLELIITMAVISTIIAISAPRIRDTMEKINVRSAKVAVANYVARTRSSAVGRSCRTVMHITQGTSGRVWITSCRSGDIGRTLAVDTVGKIDSVAARFGVNLASTVDSLSFDGRGLATTFAFSTISVRSVALSTVLDSIRVNPIGKVVLR